MCAIILYYVMWFENDSERWRQAAVGGGASKLKSRGNAGIAGLARESAPALSVLGQLVFCC